MIQESCGSKELYIAFNEMYYISDISDIILSRY